MSNQSVKNSSVIIKDLGRIFRRVFMDQKMHRDVSNVMKMMKKKNGEDDEK